MMDFAAIGWRDAVLVVAGLSAVYLVFTVLRLVQVGKRSQKPDSHLDVTVPSLTPASEAVALSNVDPTIDLTVEIPPELVVSSRKPAVEPVVAPPAADFARELSRSNVEVELQQLRRESKLLSEEVAKLREELASLKAARNVSPLYGEAMALAQQGVPAAGISGQCGISLAEAELVAALAHGQSIEQHFDTDEGRHGGYPDSRTGTHG